jgi:Protein of unknown function (DUF2721)
VFEHRVFRGTIKRMNITISTPALLFPAISLLMLAYTNRFLALAALIRQLRDDYRANHDQDVLAQIAVLRFRVRLILWMQGLGIFSLALCIAAMLVLLADFAGVGSMLFAASLLLMLGSLVVSVWEIRLSANALDVALKSLM